MNRRRTHHPWAHIAWDSMGIIVRMRRQDQSNEDGLPDWLDPIYDEDDPREYMQVLSPELHGAWRALRAKHRFQHGR